MFEKWYRTARIALGAAVLCVSLSACSACRSSSPREHWWEIWKPKPALNQPIYTDDEIYSPPPVPEPAYPGGAGEVQPLPGEGAPVDDFGIDVVRPPSEEPRGMVNALQTIYFAYDSDRLEPSETQVLERNAEWLKAHPEVMVQVEGHCDERGTPEYNLNLGQRRADRVREFLVGRGVAPDRLVTISYGEERPIDTGKTEQSYQMNRRVQFLVY